jgi:glycosyltransferase involved in cell wall biosynthesis
LSRRLRVAIVAPTLGILGGQSVQAAEILRHWSGDPDVEAWLVPVDPPMPPGLGWAAEVKYARTVATQLAYWPRLWRELRHADVVHVFSASYTSFLLAPLPATLIAKALGKPVLLNYHSGEAPDHLRRSRVARAALARVDALVVPSRFLVDVFAGFGLEAEAIPNVIDRSRFPFRARPRPRPHVISTRNLEPNYNVACTLRAFARVQARRPEATLTVVGAGSEAVPLKVLAHALGLRGVRFVGRVAPEAMGQAYGEADVYVQTPAVDNMPLSVLEAFASGLPVVSTDTGGVGAILTDGVHGLLAAPDDDAAVAAAILRLLDEPGLAPRLADAGFQSTAALTWEVVRDRWRSVYARLARPAATPAAEPRRA